MANETTTLNVNVDLDCPRCYRQIRKVLCKLQATADQERIRTISYSESNHTISITGPFDPLKLCCKVRCMGGKVIRDIQIKPPPPPPPPPQCTCKSYIEQLKQQMVDIQRQLNGQNRDIEQLKQEMENIQGHQQSCEEMRQDINQLQLKMAELEKQLHKRTTDDMVYIPSITSCSCGCSLPFYSGQYEGCRRDRVNSYAAARLAGWHVCAPYCGCYKGCQFSEEDASTTCIVM
ncbi:unnamed protein product [Urochloa decumbens]|uniref:HMA domain-containing protein n=1 Tax=Urochloa decumbens TaxID=240449 RepID=A0ABC9D6X8_9POAL